MTTSLDEIKIVNGSCPFVTGELAFQDSAPINQCVFLASQLHTVKSRAEAFSLVASIEHGCGSCSNVILHPIEGENSVEVIWSGCGNVKGPIIDKALKGLELKNLDLIEEHSGFAHVIVVSNSTYAEIEKRFISAYTN
jgi:hypothetical protein